MALDATQIAFLRTEAGRELLGQAGALSGELLTRLTRLRRHWAPDQASAALELLALRERGRAKFRQAPEMFFTPEGLEQASGETIAQWRASRFPSGARVLDLCCGNGGDAVALGARGSVLAFDMNPAAALCAKANAEACGVADRVHVACADVTHLRLSESGADATFFDPSRRRDGKRIRTAEAYAPPLDFIDVLRAEIPDLAVKVSPALEDGVIEAFQAEGGRVEFVSDRGECKEAILWFGGLGPRAARSATLLPQGFSLVADPTAPPPGVITPRAWLYEPNAAVIRAHLIAETAALVQGSQVDAQIAYLTGEEHVRSPFTTAYPVLEWLPFSAKRIQTRLKALGRRVIAIKRRGVPLEPADLKRQLTGAGDLEAVVVLTRVNGAPAAILCAPPEPSDV